MYSGNLCATLAACSATIWNERARAQRVKLNRLETTDTELIVQNLTESLKSTKLRAGLRVFPPMEEADTGADLEIWLGLTDGLSIGFTIQAKRTTMSVRRFLTAETIMQKSGTSGRTGGQLDDLIEHGKRVEANPVHLLYSGWNDPRTDDPLVRGSGTPTQYGASIVPTWWFREALNWPNRKGAGKGRIDRLGDIVLPFEWLLKPEDIGPSAFHRGSFDPWFTREYLNTASSARTRNFLPHFLPLNHWNFPSVEPLVRSGLGLTNPSNQLLDYAFLGLGMGAAEYGPAALTGSLTLDKPFDFGLSRNPPPYVPDVGLRSADVSDKPARDDRSARDRDFVNGGEAERPEQGDDFPATDPNQGFGSHRSRVFVDVVNNDDMVKWQRRSGVEAIPRIVLAVR